jgi:hypothetical protein
MLGRVIEQERGKRMQLTKLRAAPNGVEVPPGAPAGETAAPLRS